MCVKIASASKYEDLLHQIIEVKEQHDFNSESDESNEDEQDVSHIYV